MPIAPDRQPSPGPGMTMYQTHIGELMLFPRTYNSLLRAQIHTVGDVLEKKEEDLLKIRNFGVKSLEELKHRLAERGFI